MIRICRIYFIIFIGMIFIVSLYNTVVVFSQDEEISIFQSDDPATKGMLNTVEKAGLSLHPAQYYEPWEMKRNNVDEA